MTKIRTLVVDDEPMARERILGLLAQETDVEVVGQCADGVEKCNAEGYAKEGQIAGKQL